MCCCFGWDRKKRKYRKWSPDGSRFTTLLSPTFSTDSLVHYQHQQPSSGGQPRLSPPLSLTQEPYASTPSPSCFQRAPSSPSLPPVAHSSIPQRPTPAATTHPPRLAANTPWMSTPPRSPAPVYSNGVRNRFHSTASLPSAMAGQLHSAHSVGNLHHNHNHNNSPSNNMAETQNGGFYERISARLNEVIDEIDHEVFRGGEFVLDPTHHSTGPQRTAGPVSATKSLVKAAGGCPLTGSTSFSKVWLYSNSRLPPYLPPLKVYMPTYPLLCLAAQYSLRVYEKPTAKEREDHIKSSIFHRTKAMTLKSLPIDDMNTIVFAIRGSAGFTDWAVNFRPVPLSPEGFLDDPGNLCHAGFLGVAKGMIRPVAARLRTLLAENPSRSTSSLLITGHSAGGAVAQLLYTHMLSKTVDSELAFLAGFFKRVHCVTFGAPPVSLLPLTTPRSKQNRKSLFFSFVNEGDPVARADKAIIRSLLKLYATPAPVPSTPAASQNRNGSTWRLGNYGSSGSGNGSGSGGSGSGSRWQKPSTWAAEANARAPAWVVPSATLSLAGRVILLRPKYDGTGPEDVEAVQVSDELLREVVFGDPACHTMTMYSKRIEILATQAVTVGGFRS